MKLNPTKNVTLYSVNLIEKGMKIETTKLNVMKKLMSVEEEALLNKIDKILDEEMIVAYTVDGQPLTLEAYNKRLAKGEEQIKNGEFISHEDLGREMEGW